MLPRDLCPSCRQSFGEFSPASLSYHAGELLNQPSATFTGFHNSLKCSNCDKLFSFATQAHTEHRANEVGNSEVENYFDGSSSWTTQTQTYQPGPLGTEYFQTTHLEDGGNNLNLVDPEGLDENIPYNLVADEYVKYVGAVITDCQDINFGEDESFWNWLGREFHVDLNEVAEKIASKSVERQNSTSESAQTNSTTSGVETQSNCQPQLATGFNSSTAFVDRNGRSDHLKFLEQMVFYLENPKEGQDQQQSSAPFSFVDLVHPVYSISTNQRVSVDEIYVGIQSNFMRVTIGASNRKSFICRIKHECRKVFTTMTGIRDHLFCNLFFIRCTICQLNFYYTSIFNKHLKDCKETTKCTIQEKTKQTMLEASVPDPAENQFQLDTENRRKRPFWEKLSDWKHPTYRRDTDEKVSVEEIQTKISENYAIVKSKGRPYICLVEHNCHRYYTIITRIKEHLFGHFFYYRCAECGTKSRRTANMKRHLTFCPKSDQNLSEREHSASEESDQDLFNSADTTGIPLSETRENCSTVPEREITMKSQVKAKKRKYSNGCRIYRCLYCDYECQPRGLRSLIEHLNGRSIDGKLHPPDCFARRELRPADPETGLYEQLEPIFVGFVKTI